MKAPQIDYESYSSSCTFSFKGCWIHTSSDKRGSYIKWTDSQGRTRWSSSVKAAKTAITKLIRGGKKHVE